MSQILSALAPVVLLIVVGYLVGRRGLVDAHGSAQISRLCFSMLSPALLFRTMSQISVQASDLVPVLAYFAAVLTLFAVIVLARGRGSRAVVLALSGTYSNLVMIGIPLITLAFGQEGLVYLFALLSVHSLILLTLATVSLEWSRAREQALGAGAALPADAIGAPRPTSAPILLRALRNSVLNPVVLPIASGILWAQTGWTIPPIIDRPLQWMGQAFSPLALLLVGMSLAQILGRGLSTAGLGARTIRETLALALCKNLIMPVMVAGLCALAGIRGLSAVVIVVAAALPTGATVFMFAQRYGVGRDQVAGSVALSTLVALPVLPLAMFAAGLLL